MLFKNVKMPTSFSQNMTPHGKKRLCVKPPYSDIYEKLNGDLG